MSDKVMIALFCVVAADCLMVTAFVVWSIVRAVAQ